MSETKPNGVKALQVLPPEVAIDIPKSEVANRANADAAMQRLGLTKVSAAHIDACASVGIYMKGTGIVPGQHGSAFVSQAQMKEAMDAIMKRIAYLAKKKDKIADRTKEIDKLDKLTRAIGYLADKLAKSHKIVLDSSGESNSGPAIPPPATVKSFRPGEQVRASVGVAPPETKVVVQAGGNLTINQESQKP